MQNISDQNSGSSIDILVPPKKRLTNMMFGYPRDDVLEEDVSNITKPLDDIQTNSRVGFIGIHLGVGRYKNCSSYKELTHRACRSAIAILRSGGLATDACAAAVKVLEDDPLVNAGFGSNLTIDGTVECDASIMSGQTLNYGACAAVSGIKNPIILANKICEQQSVKSNLGLIPPCLLVGEGAKQYAQTYGLPLVENDELVSRRSRKQYSKYKKFMIKYNKTVTNNHCHLQNIPTDFCDTNDTLETTLTKTDLNRHYRVRVISGSDCAVLNSAKRRMLCSEARAKNAGINCSTSEEVDADELEAEGSIPKMMRWDTVGAVCLDLAGQLASACSSGGIVLKHSGRVGQAAMIGAGVWADHLSAVSTTGCGEYLIKTQLAKEIAQCVSQTETDLSTVLKEKFLDSDMLRTETNEKIAGAVVLSLKDDDRVAEFSWSHTMHSMSVGYMKTSDAEPQMVLSQEPGTTCFRFPIL